MNKNLIMTVLGITIGVLVLSTVLVPIVSEAQKNAGETVTFQNNGVYGYHIGESDESVTLTFTSADGWKLNGVLAVGGFTVITDTVSVRTSEDGMGGVVTTPDEYFDIRSQWHSSPATLVCQNGVVTFDYSSSTPYHYEGVYTWILQPKENGEWQSKAGLGTVYANSINDILVAGYYSTEDNDTSYLLKNGVLVAGEYETNVSYDQTKVDGTTDVYRINNLSLSVGDESFGPWFVLVKSEIIGHEDNGAAYSIYAVIPVLMIVALMVYAVSVIRNRD